jgi:hypothetical protein
MVAPNPGTTPDMTKRSLASLALAAGLAASVVPAPALADGAASTRNIILGGAAAAAGTLILINHNKQVHAREAAMAQQQADAQAAAQNAQAAYAAERQAYLHQVALNKEYQHEVAVQHNLIVQMRKQLAQQQAPANGAPTRVAAARSISYGWGQL